MILLQLVDARVGDVPHADRERKVGVHAVDEETARGVAVLSVVRQHVQLGWLPEVHSLRSMGQ